MKNKLNKVVSGLLFTFMLALVATVVMPTQTTNAATKTTHSIKCKYVLKPGQTVNVTTYYSSGYTWSSENPKIASVDQNGKVTAKKAGMVNIYLTSSSGYKSTIALVGVKTKNYYPSYEKRYKVGKDIPAGEYVLFKDPKVTSEYCFWTIYPSNKTSATLLDIGETRYASTVKLTKGTYVEVMSGYLVPLKKVAKSKFSLKNINKDMKKATSKVDNRIDAKVGYGLPAGTYKITLSGKANSGYVFVSSQPRGIKYNPKKTVESKSLSKSYGKTDVITLKKGQYVTIQNTTLTKIK